jgi:hypothetical protein
MPSSTLVTQTRKKDIRIRKLSPNQKKHLSRTSSNLSSTNSKGKRSPVSSLGRKSKLKGVATSRR